MSTTITDLGVPILSKILSYVPDKKSCCLVNRYFYKASCNAMEDNTWLKLQMSNPHCGSIIASTRKIRNVLISSSTSNTLFNIQGSTAVDVLKIIAAHGVNIFRLHIVQCSIRLSDLSSLLSSLPRVKSITVISSYSAYENNDVIILPQLKFVSELKLLYCNRVIQTYIMGSIADNKVESFIYTSDSFESVQLFLLNQRNIKKLSLHDPDREKKCSHISKTFFQYVALHELSLTANGFNGQDLLFRSIIQLQAVSLMKLDLSGSIVGGKVFRFIARIATRLECLKLNVNALDSDDIFSLQFLQNLNELTVINNSDQIDKEQLDVLAVVKLPKLSKLEIIYPMIEISPRIFHKLQANFWGLKHLHVESQLDYATLTAILANCEELEVLVLRSSVELNPLEQGILALSNEINVCNLRHFGFFVNVSIDSLFPIDYYDFFPHLASLEIQTNSCGEHVTAFISSILDDFPSIRQLKVDNFKSVRRIDDLAAKLKAHANHMHLVSFYADKDALKLCSNLLRGVFADIYVEGERIVLRR